MVKSEVSHTLYLRNNENPYGNQYKRYPNFCKDCISGLPEADLGLVEAIDRNCDASPPLIHTSNIVLTPRAANALEQIFKAFLSPALTVSGMLLAWWPSVGQRPRYEY